MPVYKISKAKMNDVQVDSVVQGDPDETTPLTNEGVTFSNINGVSHTMNNKNRQLYFSIKLPPSFSPSSLSLPS